MIASNVISMMRQGFTGSVFRAGVLLLGMLTAAATQAADEFTASTLAEHVYLVQGPSGNTLVAEDSDGLILIEGVPAEYARSYLRFVRDLTGQKKIRVLVNTHWHPESAGLNASLASSDTLVVAHANTRQWLGSTIRKRGDTILHTPVKEKNLPDTIFYDKYSIPFRGASIELGFMLQAHTDGDVYAYFPQQDILFTGPVISEDRWNPVDEATNGFIGGMMDALDMLNAMVSDNTTVVPESGAVLDKAGLAALTDMYKGLKDEMTSLLRQSRSAEEVVIANPAVGLKPEWGDPSEFLDQGFRSFYGHLRNTRHVGVMP